MGKMRAFYERLGLKASSASNANITFFQLKSIVLALYGYEALADDAATEASVAAAFRSFTMAWNTESRGEVETIMAHAEAAGAEIKKPAQDVFWGGYSGYFSDPEGNIWEVAHNPFVPFDANGVLRLP